LGERRKIDNGVALGMQQQAASAEEIARRAARGLIGKEGKRASKGQPDRGMGRERGTQKTFGRKL
jgi:hypothetical protein